MEVITDIVGKVVGEAGGGDEVAEAEVGVRGIGTITNQGSKIIKNVDRAEREKFLLWDYGLYGAMLIDLVMHALEWQRKTGLILRFCG